MITNKFKILLTIITMTLLFIFNSSQAAIIVVNAPNGALDNSDGLCSISEAIENANQEMLNFPAYDNCTEGEFGTDTIVLNNNIILSEIIDDDSGLGHTGTPAIKSAIIIDGSGFSIKRNSSFVCNLNNNATAEEFRILYSHFTSTLELINITLDNGCADGTGSSLSGTGGGLFNDGNLSISKTTFINNQAYSSGGAMMSQSDSISAIMDSSFITNSANSGGAIFLESDVSTISNSTFFGNSASFRGGAIFLNFLRASINEATINAIKNTSFHQNESGEGGGAIYANGIIQNLNNSLFAANISQNSQGTGSIDPLLFDTQDSDCKTSDTINGNASIAGNNNISHYGSSKSNCPGLITPLLNLLTVDTIADNGGPTKTVAISGNSIAFDKAINGTALGQRGFPTIGKRDIGAFETSFPDMCFSENFEDLSIDGFDVNVGTAQGLIVAIICSNKNGSQTDTIRMAFPITLDTEYKQLLTDNRTGTPAIGTNLIIDGQGHTLKRNNNLTCNLNGIHEPGEFRLLENKFQNNLTIKNIVLDNGCADGTNNEPFGGALYNDGDVSLINVHFTQNQSFGGGGAIYHNNGRTINEITNSTFSNNFTNGSGGAIYNQGDIITIQNTTFSGNAALGFGGAINNEFLVLNLINNTFSNNDTAASGGAIANFNGIGKFQNNTFSANSSANDGGAIYNDDSISRIENNTFSGNTTTNYGSALRNNTGATVLSIKNTLFHNNNNNDCIGTGINGSNNLSDNASSSCPGLITPMLTSATVKALANNGGPTKTHGLQPGSQALDAAVSGLSTDQRGLLSNGIRDIGAYEAQSDELCSVPLQVDGFSTVVANVDELNTAINCSKVNGSNLDTITLSADITLVFAYENDLVTGLTGTPGITTPLMIDGQGFMIQRDASLTCNRDNITDAGEFRLLHNHMGNSLTLTNIKLINGCSDGPFNTFLGAGGSIYNEGNLAIISNSFSQNKARIGGAIFNSSGTITEITSSTFSANIADKSAGAIYNLSDITVIQNSTFSGNQASLSGGAISNPSGASITSILNSTFSGNTSPPSQSGGAIYNAGTINFLKNSLFHNNSSSDCTVGGAYSFANNNISDNASSVCPGLLATILTSSTIAPLADYGGLTQTHTLLAGSEAFNAAGNGRLVNDQRGFFALDGSRDIGAVEDQAPTVTAPMDITVEATGVFTSIIIEQPTVNDPDQPNLVATTSSNTGPFPLGQHTIIWNVIDNHGRTDSDSQTITVVDTTPPVITLLGSNPIIRPIGFNYIDSGATAQDDVDGFFNSTSITVVNPVNTALAGNYTITYDVQDNAGNNAIQVTRLVKIQASIGGSVSGLVNTNTVTISDGNQSLVLGNGNYTFNTLLDSGTHYLVSLSSEPNDQSCQINNNSGTIADSNINNINITCGPLKYFIGGMASGLEIGNPVVLALDTELLTVSDNAAFVFLTPLLDGADYTVTIDTLPQNYSCNLMNPIGTIAMGDVTDLEVNCSILDLMFNDSFE